MRVKSIFSPRMCFLLVICCSLMLAGFEEISSSANRSDGLTRIPGTGIFMKMPNTFIQNPNTMDSYVQSRTSDISARVIQNDYDLIKKTANWDFYKDRGYKLVSEEPITISGFEGHYLETIIDETRSIQISVGNSTQTFQIFGECHALNKAAAEELKSIFKSVSIDENFDVPWNDLLGFRLNPSYKKGFKLKFHSANTCEFESGANVVISIQRIVNVPNDREQSEAILMANPSVGLWYRRELQFSEPLIYKDTVINGHKAKLIESSCKKSGEEAFLLQLLMEGETQRILFTCQIEKAFDKNKVLVYDFINNIEIE